MCVQHVEEMFTDSKTCLQVGMEDGSDLCIARVIMDAAYGLAWNISTFS
jgi:hypothetical protein